MTQLTSEIFESNDLTVYQPARGHRYGAESVALMRFVRAEPGLAFCELGAGCGLISLVIATELAPASVTAVEIQKTLHEIALYNISENELDDIVACVNEDIREFAKKRARSFDVVVANPPFFKAPEGRLSPLSQRAMARHELNGTIEDFVKAAHTLLKSEGRFFVVFDSRRSEELRTAAKDAGFKTAKVEEPETSAYFLLELSK